MISTNGGQWHSIMPHGPQSLTNYSGGWIVMIMSHISK